MKRTLMTLLLLVVMAVVQAHEFWLQPLKFFYKPGERLSLKFMVGENFMGEPWDLKKHSAQRLELWQLNKSRNLKDSVTDSDKANLRTQLKEPGTHVIVMQSNNAFIELDAEKFNAYLKEDGLDDVLAKRTSSNTLTVKAREHYSRHTKLLIQVGDKKDDTFKKEFGLPVEIIPETNPYSLKKGDVIRFKVLIAGKPAFGSLVKIWNRHDNRTTIQNLYPQKDGIVETRVSSPGAWMVSAVTMIPSKQPDADWQSYWGSLVFGVE